MFKICNNWQFRVVLYVCILLKRNIIFCREEIFRIGKKFFSIMIYISFFEYMLYIYTSNDYMHICHRQIRKWRFKLLFGCLGLYKTWYFTYLNYSTYPGFPLLFINWYYLILRNKHFIGAAMKLQNITLTPFCRMQIWAKKWEFKGWQFWSVPW